MASPGTLTFFCGKMGAGKSTHAKRIATAQNAVLLSEDHWLATLYPGQIQSFDDYLKYSALLKPLVKAHVQDILRTGTSVVMDFPANTAAQRKWFVELCEEAGCKHQMVYLDISDAQCLEQIAVRCREQPERARFDTEVVFRQVTRFFEVPSDQEGLNVVPMTTSTL